MGTEVPSENGKARETPSNNSLAVSPEVVTAIGLMLILENYENAGCFGAISYVNKESASNSKRTWQKSQIENPTLLVKHKLVRGGRDF